MEFDVGLGNRGAASRKAREDGDPFRLLLVADFSGRAAARQRGDVTPLKRPVTVDAAEVDRAVAALAPALVVTAPGVPDEVVRPVALEDFHPDQLFARLAMFEEPRRLRRELRAAAGGDTFAAVEAWLRSVTGDAATVAAPAAASESEASALERLLGRAPATPAAASPTGALQGIFEQAVRPHVTSDGDVQRRAMLQGLLDEAIAARMQAVLASPALRAAEAAWRGVDRVARAVDTDQELVLSLFDACPLDLDDALAAAGGDLQRSEVHRLWNDQGRSWTLIAVGWPFGLELAELQRLAQLGALAARGGAVLLGDASLTLLGCSSPEQAADPERWQTAAGGDAAAFWQALRESPLARWVGLVMPRVLARLPYGRKTDPIEAFPFEELSSAATRSPAAERLWGSGAFALAQLHAAAFRAEAWAGNAEGTELDDLPSHTFDDEGESRLAPAGEVAWPERAVEPLLARGITPLVARRDRAALHLARACSIALPPMSLTLSTEG